MDKTTNVALLKPIANRTAPDRSPSDDLALVRRLVERDARAWREFDRVYRPKINARVRSIVRYFAAAQCEREEIVGNVFCALVADDCARLRQYDPSRGSLGAYVLRIARNKAWSYLRALRCRGSCPSGLIGASRAFARSRRRARAQTARRR